MVSAAHVAGAAPAAPSRPGVATVTVRACDGVGLAATVYSPATGIGSKTAIFASSMGDRKERYRDFARFLAGRGWNAVTFDYRSIGGSRGPGASGASLWDWGGKDLAAAIDWASNELRAERLVAVVHSVGGQVLGLAPNAGRLDAVLAVGAQKGYWRHYPAPRRWAMRVAAAAVPALLALYGGLPGRFFGTDDFQPGVMRDWRRWALHPHFVDATGRPSAGHGAFDAPILALSFEDDLDWAPAPAVDALLAIYSGAPSLHRRLRPRDLGVARVGHSGFFDPEVCPAALWSWAAAWLDRASRQEPSLGAVHPTPE